MEGNEIYGWDVMDGWLS